jgi:hypothetical protein
MPDNHIYTSEADAGKVPSWPEYMTKKDAERVLQLKRANDLSDLVARGKLTKAVIHKRQAWYLQDEILQLADELKEEYRNRYKALAAATKRTAKDKEAKKLVAAYHGHKCDKCNLTNLNMYANQHTKYMIHCDAYYPDDLPFGWERQPKFIKEKIQFLCELHAAQLGLRVSREAQRETENSIRKGLGMEPLEPEPEANEPVANEPEANETEQPKAASDFEIPDDWWE